MGGAGHQGSAGQAREQKETRLGPGRVGGMRKVSLQVGGDRWATQELGVG